MSCLRRTSREMRGVRVVVLMVAMLAPGRLTMAAPQNDSNVRPPVTEGDVRIVQRAEQILDSPEHWNRADNRKCPVGATKFSLYCAMEKATDEISGDFEHRGAAMQEVRFRVDAIAGNRGYQHRIMDYNNDPKTTLEDIQKVLKAAETTIRQRLAEQQKK
jgi:hypothetical protein